MTELTEAELEEQIAKAIYGLMPYDGPAERGKPDWVEHGNSHKQQEARNYARAAIRASLSPWREISSAPKDESWLFLLGRDADGAVWLVGYYDDTWRSGWDGGTLSEFGIEPTHWMPLPPAPHSNGERDDASDRSMDNLADPSPVGDSIDRLVDLPSDAKPDVLCSVPDCPIHTHPPTPTQGEVEREKLNKASRQADAAMERMLDKLQRLGQEFDASPLGIAGLVEEARRWAHWVRCETPLAKEHWEVLGEGHELSQTLDEAAAALLEKLAAGQGFWFNTAQSRRQRIKRLSGYLKRAHEEAGEQEIELLDAKRQIRAQAREIERLKSHLTEIANCEECLACQHVAMSALGGEVTFKSELMEANEQNRKLREALEKILEASDVDVATLPEAALIFAIRAIARAALNRNEG